MTQTPPSPAAEAYCRACDYQLRGIGEQGKCPECGREFDLADPKSFTRFPKSRRVWRIVRWPVYGVLLLVLASALGLGWLYWDWKQDQAAVAWISEGRSIVKLRLIGPAWVRQRAGKLAWLLERAEVVEIRADPEVARAMPVLRLRWVRKLGLHGDGWDDAALAKLRVGDGLEALQLAYTSVGEAGLRRLGKQPCLRDLSLLRSAVTDAVLAALADYPELQLMSLSGTGIQGPGLENLRHVAKLQYLRVDDTAVDDAALVEVGRCAGLKDLSLDNTRVRGPGLAHLAGLKHLRYLSLYKTAIDDSAVEHLAKLTGLEGLYVRGTKLTRAGVDRLRKALPKTEIYSDK